MSFLGTVARYIDELEKLLNSEEDNPIQILLNGEIREVGQTNAADLGTKKPLTMAMPTHSFFRASNQRMTHAKPIARRKLVPMTGKYQNRSARTVGKTIGMFDTGK